MEEMQYCRTVQVGMLTVGMTRKEGTEKKQRMKKPNEDWNNNNKNKKNQ